MLRVRGVGIIDLFLAVWPGLVFPARALPRTLAAALICSPCRESSSIKYFETSRAAWHGVDP
jgi:hypothetical protein